MLECPRCKAKPKEARVRVTEDGANVVIEYQTTCSECGQEFFGFVPP